MVDAEVEQFAPNRKAALCGGEIEAKDGTLKLIIRKSFLYWFYYAARYPPFLETPHRFCR